MGIPTAKSAISRFFITLDRNAGLVSGSISFASHSFRNRETSQAAVAIFFATKSTNKEASKGGTLRWPRKTEARLLHVSRITAPR